MNTDKFMNKINYIITYQLYSCIIIKDDIDNIISIIFMYKGIFINKTKYINNISIILSIMINS
jgi:hypothetical protein